MEQDTRIGLALGILLMGIVAALFFRNEPAAEQSVPEMQDTESLDAQIAERRIAPYLKSKRRIPPPRPEVLAHNAGRSTPQGRDRATAPAPIPRQSRKIDVPPSDTPRGRDRSNAAAEARTRTRSESQTDPRIELRTESQTASQVVDPGGSEKPVPEPQPELQEYEVRPGDTLSDISRKFLGSSGRYMEIFELNRDRLRTPHDLRTGRRILVPRVRR